MSNLIPPRIHLNGSSAEHLMEQYQNLSKTLADAIDAAYEVYPNPRDYYVISNTAHGEARAAFETMTVALESFRTQVEDCIQNIQNQVDERKSR